MKELKFYAAIIAIAHLTQNNLYKHDYIIAPFYFHKTRSLSTTLITTILLLKMAVQHKHTNLGCCDLILQVKTVHTKYY